MNVMNDWTNRKPFVATEAHVRARWGSGFDCKCCGHKFQVGDTVRWIYANSTAGANTGNFFVCGDCDGNDDDVIAKAKEGFQLAVTLAKRWNIYGPDWEREALRDIR